MSSNFVKEQKQIDLFKIYVSKFFFYLKNKQDCLNYFKQIQNVFQNCQDVFDSKTLLKLDNICISGFEFVANTVLFKEYVDDYTKNYLKAIKVMSKLQSSLNSKDNLYYTEILNTGSYDKKDFDVFGLLLDPTRKFMNEQKNIYDEKQEYELVDLSPAQQDNLDLLLELRKRIITKAEDLYLGEQIEYMERGLINSDLEKIEPFKNYKTLKEESLKDAGILIAMARDKKLFLIDLNQPYDRPKLICREELINADKDSPILDHDNYELVDQNGNTIEPKLIRSFEKNLKYLKEDLLNLELTTGNRIKPKRKKLTLG